MPSDRTLIGAALIAAGISPFVLASAQMPADAVQGIADGHAYITGPTALAPALQRSHLAYDLQLSATEGRHDADVPGLKLTISDSAGHAVFRLADAEALTEVQLPAGHYHVLADFGRIKRLSSVDIEPGLMATLHLHKPD